MQKISYPLAYGTQSKAQCRSSCCSHVGHAGRAGSCASEDLVIDLVQRKGHQLGSRIGATVEAEDKLVEMGLDFKYPRLTREVCEPPLARASGLRQGIDFKLGYSPERINPGDQAAPAGDRRQDPRR